MHEFSTDPKLYIPSTVNINLILWHTQFLLETQDILPKTSPFLVAQMAVLSSFFQMFIALGMYNFVQAHKCSLLMMGLHIFQVKLC